MTKRVAFFYFMKNDPVKIKKIVPLHIEFWKKLDLQGYLGGPFADRSGGFITFKVENIEEASKIIASDPFVTELLIKNKWIKEWIPEG